VLYLSTSAARSAASAAPSSSGTSSSTESTAASTCSLVAPAWSVTAAHNAAGARSAFASTTRSICSTRTRLAFDSSREAFSSFGSIASRSPLDLRRAGLINLVAISNANRSSASSIASASNDRVTATNVAVRRGSSSFASSGALLPAPYRARVFIRRIGTLETSIRPSSNRAMSSTRFNARTSSAPDCRFGACRNRSNSENRDPSGTSSSPSNARGRPESARLACRATVAKGARPPGRPNRVRG
jgi:hypothetical protein